VSRRRQSPPEELLELFVELPFWASLVGAAFFFLTLQFVPPLFAGTSITANMFAAVSVAIAPWAAALSLAAGLVGIAKRLWTRSQLSRATTLAGLKELTWRDLEAVVGEAYRRQGYAVTQRGGPQPDGGIDLELRRDGERLIVQCKHWLNREVPVQKVRELLGVVAAERANGGILVAIGDVTSEARNFATGQPITLIDGQAFARLAQSIDGPRRVVEATLAKSTDCSPLCPAVRKDDAAKDSSTWAPCGVRVLGLHRVSRLPRYSSRLITSRKPF
jgi:restriction system protein